MVSVCIPTYNGDDYIEEQMRSIICQLGKNDEIIISDDSSNDKTIEKIKSFNDCRIKIFENQKFKSPIFNLENALRHASNEYIFLSDQDDIWFPDKIEIMMKYLKNYDLVVSDAMIIDKEGKVIGESFFKINKSKSGLIKNIIKNSYLGACMAFNRKVLEKALPFPKDIPMHDWWIGLVAEACCKVFFLNQPLVYYRRHDTNFSSTCGKSRYNLTKKINFRYILIKNLLYRNIKLCLK